MAFLTRRNLLCLGVNKYGMNAACDLGSEYFNHENANLSLFRNTYAGLHFQ
jgi:hypothetical protein